MEQQASARASRLRAVGLKVTGPRLAILAMLERNPDHPSAEEVHRSVLATHPSLSLSTVYMTLEAFARCGLARKLAEVDGRLRIDGFDQPHDHAVCRGCRRIFDIARWPGTDPAHLSLPDGLELFGTRVEYDVLCRTCREPGRL